jgi:hypothetical protein
MKIGDLVMIRDGFHSLANHNNPPPNGKIAIILKVASIESTFGCTYTIASGGKVWSHIYGSRLKLLKG